MSDTQRAQDQAKAQLEGIIEMVNNLTQAENNDDDDVREEAMQIIMEDPLSVEVRSDWHSLNQGSDLAEYKILLCTGGPACQIIGELNQYNEPETAQIEYQDWFIPWIDYPIDIEEEAALLIYARCFYFGE